MQKIVCIVGPTGVGKTDLAFDLARKYNGELVSVDSVQVYKGLNIVSGKDLPKDYTFVPLPDLSKKEIYAGYFTHRGLPPIHLLDVVEPTFSFSVNNFVDLAGSTINFISDKKMLPIVVGGTGLYLKALIEGLDVDVKPNLLLRNELEKLDIVQIQERLRKISPQTFMQLNNSERNNKRRLIRKIEILSYEKRPATKRTTMYDSLIIGLSCNRELLKRRIDERVSKRIEQGALKECEVLFSNYEDLSSQVKNANGYKQIFSFLKKEITWEECIFRWKIAEHQYSKNQMTWFQKYSNVIWFDIEKKGYKKEIENSLKNFIS